MASNEDCLSSTSSDGGVLQKPSKRPRLPSDSEESSWSSSSDMISAYTVRRRRIETDSGTEAEDTNNNEECIPEECDVNWGIPLCKKTNITFSDSSDINTYQSEMFACTEPHDFYFLFVTNEIFEVIAKQTNIYAMQRKSELHPWHETDANEIKRFFGLIIWMGLVRLPKIEMYWGKYEGYNLTLPSTIMPLNRFELLLQFVHFSNNEENDPKNRLSKVAQIINHLNSSFKKYCKPDEILWVDEYLVPFRGRIVFPQYVRRKRHRCGIKVFKLCTGPGYTYSLRIYSGKGESTNEISDSKSTEILMDLCKDILGKGHTVCTDDRYTSVDLAEKLIDRHTHLLGVLQRNRRGNPKEVVSKKLKRGDIIARENKNKVTVLKWRDKRDVLMLSTKHSAEMTTIRRGNSSKEKPKMVVDFNSGKSPVELSDQMIAYSSPLRKTIKWYRKLAVELLLNTCIVNSFVLFKQVTGKNISIPDFRMKLAMNLMKYSDCVLSQPRHELKKKPGSARSVRRFCTACYKKNSIELGRTGAKNFTRKVVTYCSDCVGSPFLCLECFNLTHRNTS